MDTGRTPPPGEIRLDVAQKRRQSADPLVYIETERDLAAADRDECFASDDKAKANMYAEKCEALAQVAIQLAKLREINASLQTVLINRVIVALKEATRPAWEPTHEHYKGHFYRLLAIVNDANGDELQSAVVYDDHLGNRYTITKEKWESRLESGRQRYAPIVKGVGLA